MTLVIFSSRRVVRGWRWLVRTATGPPSSRPVTSGGTSVFTLGRSHSVVACADIAVWGGNISMTICGVNTEWLSLNELTQWQHLTHSTQCRKVLVITLLEWSEMNKSSVKLYFVSSFNLYTQSWVEEGHWAILGWWERMAMNIFSIIYIFHEYCSILISWFINMCTVLYCMGPKAEETM